MAPLVAGAFKFLPLLMQLADIVPSLMKYTGSSEGSIKVAEQVVNVAQSVTGATSAEEAVKLLKENDEKAKAFAFQVSMLSKEWDELFLKDLQSARQRDLELAKAGYRNYRAHSMYIIAVLAVAGLMWQIWDADQLSDFAKSIFTLCLGRFLGYLDNIYAFEFGKTRNDDQKTQIIERLSKNGHG